MNKISALTLIAFTLSANAFAGDVEWTRFKGTVKRTNLKAQTIEILNSDNDLITIPIDYQVKIVDKKNILRDLKDVELDSKVILLRVVSEKPKEDTDGLVPYRGMEEPQATTEPEPRRKK